MKQQKYNNTEKQYWKVVHRIERKAVNIKLNKLDIKHILYITFDYAMSALNMEIMDSTFRIIHNKIVKQLNNKKNKNKNIKNIKLSDKQWHIVQDLVLDRANITRQLIPKKYQNKINIPNLKHTSDKLNKGTAKIDKYEVHKTSKYVDETLNNMADSRLLSTPKELDDWLRKD